MLASVIVPIYGQLPLVLKLAQSMITHRQEHLREVFLIDDASKDFNLTELMGPPFNVIRNPQNLGFIATENLGAKAATGKYLFFLNSDMEVHENWLDPAVKLMESNEKIGVVGVKLVFPKHESVVKFNEIPIGGQFRVDHTWYEKRGSDYAVIVAPVATTESFAFKPEDNVNIEDVLIQSCGGLYDANHMPFHRYLGWKADDRRVNKTEKVSWVTGAALMTRKDIFEQAGGIDTAYGRGYFDDPDYCEKVKQAGYEVWYCAEAVITHKVGASMSESVKTDEEKWKAARGFYQNARLFEARWYSHITPDVQYVAVDY